MASAVAVLAASWARTCHEYNVFATRPLSATLVAAPVEIQVVQGVATPATTQYSYVLAPVLGVQVRVGASAAPVAPAAGEVLLNAPRVRGPAAAAAAVTAFAALRMPVPHNAEVHVLPAANGAEVLRSSAVSAAGVIEG